MSYFDPHEERSNSPVYHDYMKRWEPTERQWRTIEWLLVVAAILGGWILSGCSARSQEIGVVGAAAADVISTEVGLSNGGTESNPLMENRTARIAVKSGTTAAVILIARELDSAGHTKAASIMRMSVFTLWMGAATWNLAVAW